MKILLTGGAGYIGSIATYMLLQQGHSVAALDNFSTGHMGVVDKFKREYPDSFSFAELDLVNKADVKGFINLHKDATAVLHYAASCKVDESMKNPGKYFENNILGSLNLVEAMANSGLDKIVFSSTCAVYGETDYVPVDENHPTRPANPYGESKLMVERILSWYQKTRALNYVILRYFNVCGASDDGEVGDSKDPSVLLVQNAVRGAMGLSDFTLTCPEVDTPDKTPIRDYINVVDLNEAHIKALEYLSEGRESTTINLGTGSGNSVLEIVEKVENATGTKLPRKRGETRKGEYAEIYADTRLAETLLGWKPTRSIEDSINSLIKWYTMHPKGWLAQ